MYLVEQLIRGTWYECGVYRSLERAQMTARLYEAGYGDPCRITKVGQ